MSTKSRESMYGASIRASAERAKHARKQADRLACAAWNMRMLGYKGPAQPSPTLGGALNAGYGYLEVRCLGCDTHQTVALDRAATQDDVDPRTRALHALQGLLASPWLSLQAQPPRSAQGDKDISKRSAVDMVARRTQLRPCVISIRLPPTKPPLPVSSVA
jgi:hypothetical protein